MEPLRPLGSKMLGFSPSKIILLVVLVIAVLYGKRLIASVGGAAKNISGGGNARPVGEDTQQCPVCGIYVSAASAQACGRSDCPYKS